MKKLRIFILIAISALILVSASCKKPHEHNYIDGVCECGDTIEVKYTVTFKGFNGEVLKTESVVKNNSATAPDAPAVDGYMFVGWSVDFTNVTSNLEVNALYEYEMEYTIQFNANGGSVDVEEIIYTNYKEVELPIPTREHYVFLGWYVRDKKIEKLEKAGNYNLKAEWEGESHAINYHLNEGSLESNAPEYHYYGTSTKLPTPTREGYAFEGWYESSSFSGNEVLRIEETRTSEINVYAKWRKLNPIVTYHLNEGNWQYRMREAVIEDFLKDAMAWGAKTSKPDGMVRGEGDTQTGFANVFSAIHGIFTDDVYGPKWAWLKQYIISVSPLATQSSLRNGDEAFWRYSLGAFLFEEHRATYPISADFTVDANANGFWDELSRASQTVIELDDSLKLQEPLRIYYVFDGWYANPEFTGERITSANANTEVYAKWIEEVSVDNIGITNKIETLDRFEEYQLTWEIIPGNAAIKSVEFTSSDESIATVDDKGKIVALNNGEVTITITSLSPSGAYDSVTIIISSPDHFDISYETNSYVMPNESIKLNATFTKRDESTMEISWKSLNENVATVDNTGKVTGVASGLATIRAYLTNDENTYIDFVVTVLPNTLSEELMHVVKNHESNVFTRYDLGIGAGTPVYYADILGSVNKMLFNYDYFWDTKHKDGVMANGKHSPNLDSEEYPVEFITVHYTAGMTKGSDAEATSIFFKGATASAHFCTGNDGIFQCLDLNVRGWHAGDGTDTKFEWYNTGVQYQEGDPRWPTWGISKNAYFTINGIETNIKVPEKKERGNEGFVTDSKWLTDQGLAFKVVDGMYYMGKTWWCYSNVWEGRICSKGGNNNSIGIESAVDYGSDLWLTWQITAQLVADLMVKYDLDITRVVGHHFFAAKDCPQPLLENDLEIWWEFIEIVEAEYEVQTTFKDTEFEFNVLEGSDVVNEYGRIIAQPKFSQVVTYEVKLSDGTSVTLASVVPGIYTK